MTEGKEVDDDISRPGIVDISRGLRFYELAAEQGHADAQNNLAVLISEGHGDELDNLQANILIITNDILVIVTQWYVESSAGQKAVF